MTATRSAPLCFSRGPWPPRRSRIGFARRAIPTGKSARSRRRRRPFRVAPKFDAALATEALSGELVTVYDVKDGWAWVQLREDGYVGYTTLDCLSAVVEENTHRVSARLTYLYPAPDIKRASHHEAQLLVDRRPDQEAGRPLFRAFARRLRLRRSSRRDQGARAGLCSRRRTHGWRPLSVGRQDDARDRLLGPCSDFAPGGWHSAVCATRDMQMTTAGEPVDPSNLDADAKGRSPLLERPCGHRSISRLDDPCERASHGGCRRADQAGRGAHGGKPRAAARDPQAAAGAESARSATAGRSSSGSGGEGRRASQACASGKRRAP